MSEEAVFDIVPEQPLWVDRRLTAPNHCQYARSEKIPATCAEHAAASENVRRRLLLSAGLLPEFKLPHNPAYVSEGKIYENVVIKEVRIETLPGLMLTGSLYLPEKIEKPLPGLLCPHGHWKTGRIHHAPNGGVVMRCFELARLGFAVFSYDMLGYNDNNDLPHTWDEELQKRGNIDGISAFGLQTANSMRALDFLCELDEVDENRIGCTGASGGASQTWFISALDERIKVVVPVCMLSSHFQGGCPCEEGPLLRVTGVSSFDIVSAIAPRPILLPSVTGDWTNLNPVYEIPLLKKVYKLYGAEDKVSNFHYEDVHNYNKRTREHVYAYLVRHLMGIDRGEKIIEEEIAPPAPELIWHGGAEPAKPTPESIKKAYSAIAAFWNKDVLDTGSDFEAFRRKRIELLRQILDDGRPAATDVVERVLYENRKLDGGTVCGRTISRRDTGDLAVALEVVPEKSCGNTVTIVVADGSYRDYLGNGKNSGVVTQLLKEGQHAYILELLGSGSNSWQLKYALRNNYPLGAAFDEPLFSMRVHDIINCATLLREKGHEVTLKASGTAVPAALAAAALLDLVLEADLEGITDDIWLDELNCQPLIGKIGGIAGLLLLNKKRGTKFSNAGEEYIKLLQKHNMA